MLKQTFNKGISTPIAIGIILILVVLVGGFTWWQYGEIQKEGIPILIGECNQDSDCQDKEYKRSCHVDKITKKCVNHVCRIECEMTEDDFPKIEDETADESSKALATEDWKTYRNEELGFEFKYPKDVTIKTRLPEVWGVDIRNYSLSLPIGWNITKGRNQLNKTAQDYADFAGGTGLKSKIIDKYIVSGIEGRKVVLEFHSDRELGLADKFIQVFIVKGDFVYTFNCTNRMNDEEYDCTRFNQMLSTFRFIE